MVFRFQKYEVSQMIDDFKIKLFYKFFTVKFAGIPTIKIETI